MVARRLVRQRGVALLVLLVLVATIALLSATAVSVGAMESRRDAEEELLYVGQAFQRALRSYVDTTPGQAALGPRSMDELLRDPRVAGVRRHLRRIPADPLTGRAEWGLVKSPNGQIVGVHSLAEGMPIKRTGFDPELRQLEDAKNYQAWVFGVGLPIGSLQRAPTFSTSSITSGSPAGLHGALMVNLSPTPACQTGGMPVASPHRCNRRQ